MNVGVPPPSDAVAASLISSEATLSAAVVAGAVTAVGWLVLHWFTASRDREARAESAARADRVKRLELLLAQAETQVSKFYGPVYGLINQIWAIWEIKEKLKAGTSSEEDREAEHFIATRYFSIYHNNIRVFNAIRRASNRRINNPDKLLRIHKTFDDGAYTDWTLGREGAR